MSDAPDDDLDEEPDDDPDEELDDLLRESRLEDERRKRRAEQWVGYISGALRFFGVELVEVSFDVIGADVDSLIRPTFTPPPPGELPYGLENMIQSICEMALPEDWMSSPAFGTVLIDVASGTVVVDIDDHDEDEDEEME